MIWLTSTAVLTPIIANEYPSRISLKPLLSMNCPWVTNKHCSYVILQASQNSSKCAQEIEIGPPLWEHRQGNQIHQQAFDGVQCTNCFYVQIHYMNLHVKCIDFIAKQWKQRISIFDIGRLDIFLVYMILCPWFNWVNEASKLFLFSFGKIQFGILKQIFIVESTKWSK